jgi:hypothetical protein
MHATIQKPFAEILKMFEKGEKVFIMGCSNCAAKCKSGGETETREMAERLTKAGVEVVGWAVHPNGVSTCKLSATKVLLNETYAEQTAKADSFLNLSCGQGAHTVMDAMDGADVHPGCDTIFGGETITDDYIQEYCSLCGDCQIEYTGALCPLTLCAKQLLNGPCGGAEKGKCEVMPDRDCGWHLIYERLKHLGKLDRMTEYRPPKDFSRWCRPRSIRLGDGRATFHFSNQSVTVPAEEEGGAQ